jgi:predicted AAA+ superfamily ATPase
MVFRVYPFGAARIGAVKKEAKHYHLDWTVIADKAARFENLVACHLMKWCFFLQDTEGRGTELRYFRDVDRREVDFVLCENERPLHFVECKTSRRETSRSLRYLRNHFPKVPATQLVLDGDVDILTKDDIRICSAHRLLGEFV